MKWSIAMWQYPVKAFGDECLGIWFQGCRRSCKGCESPNFQAFKEKIDCEAEIAVIIDKILKNRITRVVISGGEPLLQADALLYLLDRIIVAISKMSTEQPDIMLYTGYEYEEVLKMPLGREILNRIGVLVDGEYKEELNDGKALRGSSNQRVIILKPELILKYQTYFAEGRKYEVVFNNNQLNKYVYIGIKPKIYF